MRRPKGVCRHCHHSIRWAEEWTKWMHSNPRHGWLHDAEPTDA